MATLLPPPVGSPAQECVVLLHGLCRTSRSMKPMAAALRESGYQVLNLDYPSRAAAIDQLSENVVGQAVAKCHRATKMHFIAHSMGGILVRSYFTRHSANKVGRVVMLGPPNQGSELVDRFGGSSLFFLINGQAGTELGTGSAALPNCLGVPDYCVGIIAGNRSINWINSLFIPGPDDGKVSVERTKLRGMTDHIVIPTTHPFIMRNPEVIRQTEWFLRCGKFDQERRIHRA
ncbi:MAG TPA: alpha/beta fold hydrolase [Verrucomicrobiae bacterium]|nr:alpha/beta fold hydrolase [Verrucomicrobiae bacterium]